MSAPDPITLHHERVDLDCSCGWRHSIDSRLGPILQHAAHVERVQWQSMAILRHLREIALHCQAEQGRIDLTPLALEVLRLTGGQE